MFILKICINHPLKIAVVAISLLIGIYTAYGKYGKGVIFFPSVEAENTKVIVYATGNLSVIEKDQLVRNVEQKLSNFKLRITNLSLYTPLLVTFLIARKFS